MEITKYGGRGKANKYIEKWTKDMTRQLTEEMVLNTKKN